MEVVTDVAFVYAMDRYLSVPVLSKAINATGVFTRNSLQDSIGCSLSFVAVGSCIKMVYMIPL